MNVIYIYVYIYTYKYMYDIYACHLFYLLVRELLLPETCFYNNKISN